MAILKMERLELVGLTEERDRLLEYLQRLGAVDLSDSSDGLEVADTEPLLSELNYDLATASSALEILLPYCEKSDGFFRKKPTAASSSLSDTERCSAKSFAEEVLKLKRKIEQNADDIFTHQARLNSLIPYLALDISPAPSATSETLYYAGILEGNYNSDRLQSELSHNRLTAVHYEILFYDKFRTAVWFIAHKSEKAALDGFLSEHKFSPAPPNIPDNAPSEAIDALKTEIACLEANRCRLKDSLCEYSKKADILKLFCDKLTLERERCEALAKIGCTKNVFFISGYLPKDKSDDFKADIEKRFTAFAALYETKKGEDVPRAFKNNLFCEPVEGITYDFSPPSSHDIDPNPIMAFFYYLFFGMMFSDAGYGILMMLSCGALGYGNIIDKSRRRIYKMFFFCGISTTFWGLMYGSFFGDMLPTLSATFGSGSFFLKPLLFDPVKKPLELLIISIALGFLHILTALSVKLYMTWHSGNKNGAVFDTLSWIVLFSGAAVYIAGAKRIGLFLIFASVLTLILTQGRDRKNIISRLFGGIASLYDITGYVGDLLSYSRLMALGLATGVIASVVNVLASLGGGGIVGGISFAAVALVGHALNFAINMLGAYVHTNRLQYVEFYQKFYEGGGRRYKPFSQETKYFNFE